MLFWRCIEFQFIYAQNPLDTFQLSRNFPIDGEVANLLRIC